MSKSNLPPLNIADPPLPTVSRPANSLISEALRKPSSFPEGRSASTRRRSPLFTWFASTVRWLHIYVSLFGFTSLTFFAVTGLTLNHPTWFGGDAQTVSEIQGSMPAQWVIQRDLGSSTLPLDEGTVDDSLLVDRLSIVEHLRATHQIRGAVAEFRTTNQDCLIIFKGPAYAADIYVDRNSGQYNGTLTTMGVVALMNDLHKGRDAGIAWSWVIDLIALLMAFVSVTGLVLVFYLKRKRNPGVVVAVVGTFVVAGIYVLLVP